jgi:hypothetical protein
VRLLSARADANEKSGKPGADNISRVPRASGTSASYLLRRRARPAPKILERFERDCV